MDRSATILKIGAGFVSASAASDWDGLEIAARTLGPQLAALAAHGPWSGAERNALAQLRAAHEHAERACAHAHDALAARLDQMRSNKAGWLAYALDSATETAHHA
jgi:hypothetical protein